MLSLVDLVQHRDHFVLEEGAVCCAFLWFKDCVLLSVMVCLLFLLVPLVGYVLYL